MLRMTRVFSFVPAHFRFKAEVAQVPGLPGAKFREAVPEPTQDQSAVRYMSCVLVLVYLRSDGLQF